MRAIARDSAIFCLLKDWRSKTAHLHAFGAVRPRFTTVSAAPKQRRLLLRARPAPGWQDACSLSPGLGFAPAGDGIGSAGDGLSSAARSRPLEAEGANPPVVAPVASVAAFAASSTEGSSARGVRRSVCAGGPVTRGAKEATPSSASDTSGASCSELATSTYGAAALACVAVCK